MKMKFQITYPILPTTVRVLVLALLWGTATAADPTPQPVPYSGPPATAPQPIHVLLITGVDHPAHQWRQTAPALAEGLRHDPRMDVRILEDPHFLDSAAINRYDVIVLHFMNWKESDPGDAARANLKRFVEGGKGLVVVHFACGAFEDWPDFVNLAGRVWNPKLRPHDPRGPFRVEITQPKHPIMKGMQSFETKDELYTCLAGDVPIEVLATATSKVDKQTHPMAFVLNVGKGRVFHSPLGHDVEALAPAAVGELFCRGTAWAAGQPPVP